ncbi:hypothetical protein [Conchiformibius kuhniae]|uniref:Pilus assembly protein n=1 Tax=Conchiformibius kuhniae TaxID=211502 RepID=A0A8T9MST7_9NEIS|nr:hypothetical protein [Conchiformibius kuhniae]
MMEKKRFPLRAKCRATFLHLALSLLVFAGVAVWLVVGLYPSFYFNMSGGVQGLMLMFGVDVVLGPLLTFLVFNPHKRLREIVSDCLIIGAVQAGALVYGLYTVYQEHPKLTVLYEYGTATALTHREVSAEPEWAALPDSAAHSSRVAGVAWTVFSQPHGKNTYQPPAKAAAVLAKADAAARRAMSPEEQAQLAQWEQSHGQVYVFAVIGKYTGAYVVLDRRFHYLTKIGEKEAGL